MLVQMTMNKREQGTFYLMEFTDGIECWAVARRYSEFREMHKRLVALFGKDYENLFQHLPPKESMGMRFCCALGQQRSSKQHWKADRQLALQHHMTDLLTHPGTSASGIVHEFVRQSGVGIGTFDASLPSSTPSHDQAFAFLLHQSPFAEDGELPLPAVEVMPLAGVRARRLPDNPGTIEVTVHTCGEPTGRRVQILRRALDGVQGDEGATSCSDFVLACNDLELQAAEGGMSEVAQQLALPVSTTWEIAARELNSSGMVGTITSLVLAGLSINEFTVGAD